MTENEKSLKARIFVSHIEEHIRRGDKGIPKDAKVVCKICGKTIDDLFQENLINSIEQDEQ